MTRITGRLLSGIPFAVAVGFAACDVFPSEPREFVIHIDSIGAPRAVSGGGAFQLFFFGPVGPNACYRFKTFWMTRTSSGADITTIGESVTGTCAQLPGYLTGEPITIAPPVSDPFTVRVHQPNGSVLARIIRVESPGTSNVR
jgi:hypothetical protein